MRRIYLLLLTVLCITSAQAQNNSSRVGLGVGVLWEKGMDATVFWEYETRYHHAWEVFANGYLKWDDCQTCDKICSDSFWRNYNTWGIGLAYKPCIIRSRNKYGSMRIGASAGSNTEKFLAGLHFGYEQNYVLRHGWQLYWQAKVDVMIPNREDVFRTGITIGLKIPTCYH